MTAYQTPPTFDDNVGQLVSAEDLNIIRGNVGLAEISTWRWAEPVTNLGGVEVGFSTYNATAVANGTSLIPWDGYLMVKTGMTTLTMVGRNLAVGTSSFSLYIDGVLKQTATPGNASWTITQSLTGYAVGQVIQITLKVTAAGMGSGSLIFVSDVYGSPVTYAATWPGVPTFSSVFSATKLNQLTNATSWVLNRSSVVPRAPMLSMRHGLGALAGPDRRPVMTAGVGKYYSQQDLRFTYQVADVALPNLHTEVWVNGSKLYDSGAHPQGTTSYDVWIDLATVTNGTVAEVEVWSNQVDSIARTAWHFSQYTIFTLTAQPNDSSIYATPATTPTPDVLLSDSALNTYLNNLAAVVSAAKARIDAQPNFYGRVRAQRKYISRPKVDAPDDFAAKRNPIRFWRGGDALVVNGRNVSMAYGGIEIPLNDRGAAYWDYKFVKSNQIIDGDKVGQQVVWLDTVPGVYRGTAYYLTGEVRWAEESLL